MKQPEIYTFKGQENGSHLVISGAVHGNEFCGPVAIERALDYIAQGKIDIVAGTVSFIPVANPAAYEKGARFIDSNLNRNLYPKDKPETYEDHIGNTLCAAFRKADVLLDLHSFNAPGEAFIYLGPSRKAEADYARVLGVRNFAHGWQDSFTAKDEHDKTSQGTTEYTRLHGDALAVTLECGSHKNPESVEVGFQAILNALEYYGLAAIDSDLFVPRAVAKGEPRAVQMTTVFYKDEEGRFAKPWKNMDEVKKGDLLAVFNSGNVIKAPADGFVMMPVEEEPVGEEWFNFGVKSDYFDRLER